MTPPVESTLSRERLALGRVGEITPSPSRSHCTAAPLDEHRAFERVAVGGGGLQQPVRRRRCSRRRCGRARSSRCRRSPSPRPAAMTALAVERGLLVAGDPADRHRRAEQLSLADDLARSRRSAAAASGRRRRARAARRPSRASRATRASSATRSSRRSRAPRRRSASRRATQSTVPNARPSRGVLAQQPLELRRREVRVGNEPGARTNQLGVELAAALGGAPVLPDDRGRDRLAGRAVPERPSSRAGS